MTLARLHDKACWENACCHAIHYIACAELRLVFTCSEIEPIRCSIQLNMDSHTVPDDNLRLHIVSLFINDSPNVNLPAPIAYIEMASPASFHESSSIRLA